MPRITRLMALAIKFQDMVDRGEVRDYADLARLGYVTRARITQIMNLLNLAADIQEAILLQQGKAGGDSGKTSPVRELRSILAKAAATLAKGQSEPIAAVGLAPSPVFAG